MGSKPYTGFIKAATGAIFEARMAFARMAGSYTLLK